MNSLKSAGEKRGRQGGSKMSQHMINVIGKNVVIEHLSPAGKDKLWRAENTVKGQAQQVVDLCRKKRCHDSLCPEEKLIK